MVARRKRPVLYLDTNIFLDVIRRRNKEAISLIEIIKRRKIRCWTSLMSLYEILDKQQENKWIGKRVQKGESFEDILRTRYPRNLTKEELRQVYDDIIESIWNEYVDNDVIYLAVPWSSGREDKEDDWDIILSLLIENNTTIADAFHVAMARSSGCNVFITRDSHLENTIKGLNFNKYQLLSASPKNIEEVLGVNGFLPLYG